jgi:hypothetical protein
MEEKVKRLTYRWGWESKGACEESEEDCTFELHFESRCDMEIDVLSVFQLILDFNEGIETFDIWKKSSSH